MSVAQNVPNEQLDRAPLDLRLVPAAILAWLSTALVLRVANSSGSTLSALLVVLAFTSVLVLLGIVQKTRRAAHARQDPGSFVSATALLCLVLAISVISAATHAHMFARHDMKEACKTRCVITASVERPSREATQGRWITHLAVPGGKILVAGSRIEARAGDQVILSGRLQAGLTPPMLGVFKPANIETCEAIGWRVAFRKNLHSALASLPPESRGLIAGMSIGDYSDLPPQARDAMVTTGTSHLTAISGLHLAILIGTINVLLPGRGTTKIALVSTIVAGLVAIVGPTPSIIRAVSMAAIPTWSGVLGRRGQPFNSLALVVLAWIIWNPWLALSVGFLLSTLSTAGVLIATTGRQRNPPPGWPKLRRLAQKLWNTASVPLAATIATSPALLCLNGSVALYAVFTNVALAPLVAPTTLLSLATAVLAQIGNASQVALLAALFAQGIIAITTWFAKLPGAQIIGPGAIATVLVMLLITVTYIGWRLLPLLVAHRIPHKPV